jgi:hypothetical protein
MEPERDQSGRILEVLRAAKTLAQEYRRLTGKPLGITGEVAEYEAARLLGVELTPARTAGSDATEDIEKEWDATLLVLLNGNFDATAIYEADRPAIIAALTARGSKARNERWALGVAKFRSIGRRRWSSS